MATYSIGGLIGWGQDAIGTSDTTITFAGLWHLVGKTVAVQLVGQDCGDFVVSAGGTVKVPLLGASIGLVDGVVSMDALVAASGNFEDLEQRVPVEVKTAGVVAYLTIPVVIGVSFVSQGQRLRPMAQVDTQGKIGPALGETKRGHIYGVLVKDAVVAQFGTSLTPTPLGDMVEETFSGPDGYAPLPPAIGFDGVWVQTWDCNYDYDNMFCWQIDRPWPFVLCATSQFIHTEERN